MSLKVASQFAFVGTGLLTFVLLVRLVMDGWSLLNGTIATFSFLAALVYAFAAASLVVFFWVFQKTSA